MALTCLGCFGINPEYDQPTGTASAESTTDESTLTGASAGPTADVGSDSDSDTVDTSQPVEVLAEIAECVALADNQENYVGPDECEQVTSAGNNNGGVGEMVVDQLDGDLGDREVHSYLKFPWHPAYRVDGAKVELILHTTADGDSQSSSQTGEIWLVDTFTLGSLAQAIPSRVGTAPKAQDMGMAGNDKQVAWELPASTFDDGQPVYIGVLPVSEDGVNYWNLDAKLAAERPVLLVTFE